MYRKAQYGLFKLTKKANYGIVLHQLKGINMERKIFYKLKRTGENWSIIFLDEDDVHTIISNDVASLKNFLFLNNDCIFIGANNFKLDDILLTSILKDGTLDSIVNDKDKEKLLPRTLDITQGIVRNELVDFNKILCSMWVNGKPMPNFYALTEDEIEKELVFDAEVIKELYNIEERKSFIEWKLGLIRKYRLPKKSYTASFGHLMKDILGLELSCEDSFEHGSTFTLDPKLKEELERKNDSFLNELLKDLNNKGTDSVARTVGNCLIRLNNQGIYGSRITDYFDTTGDSSYLYIDFNSFGPSILINNNWLDSCKHPERYREIRDLRIKLKGKGKKEQLYYKNILNAGLDDLNRVYTCDGYNVGASLSNTGIMTMMLLYRNIEKYGIELIECNTDGLIVKCSDSVIEDIRKEVRDLEEKLNLSCDVDKVTKIVHFDAKNYMMEFENGKIKHLGVFGLFQENPLNSTGTYVIDEALRRYYFNDIPVEATIREFKENNDINAFQIIKKQRANEKPKFIKYGDKYILSTSTVNRLFAVREISNPFYTMSKKQFDEYQVKKSSTAKGGFFKFFVADRVLPDIEDLDLSYYEKECYDVIKKHPKKEKMNININYNKPQGHVFVDLDGTLTHNIPGDLSRLIFDETVSKMSFRSQLDIENQYKYLCAMAGNLFVQFLGICKKYKGYGTVENFADFLMSKKLFPEDNIETYQQFVREFLNTEVKHASDIAAYSDSKAMLEGLKDNGYKIHLYSNWFSKVQKAKLEAHDFARYISTMHTIDNSYAKKSVIGWSDILDTCGVTHYDIKAMVGNGSSDMVPARFNMPCLIREGCEAEEVNKYGIIISSLDEVLPFLKEEEKRKRMRIN